MVVAMPPNKVANPTGMRISEGGILLRAATPISIGNRSTTIGVLFRKALSIAALTKVTRLASLGVDIHALER